MFPALEQAKLEEVHGVVRGQGPVPEILKSLLLFVIVIVGGQNDGDMKAVHDTQLGCILTVDTVKA